MEADPSSSTSSPLPLDPFLPIESSKCLVCQRNTAFCYNYGVLTCNACKMFFRRVEVEKVVYKCKDSLNCFLKKKRSNFLECKSCRFQQCLKVGMKYTQPGQSKPPLPVILKQKDGNVNSLIAHLMLLDARMRHRFLNLYTSEDPTLAEILQNPRQSRLTLRAKHQEVGQNEWSFLGIYTAIEFFMELDFMDQLSNRDKTILFHNFAIKSMLLYGSKRTVEEHRDTVVNPDSRDVYPDTLYALLSRDFLLRIRTLIVARLIELKVTKQECVLINVILFSNPALENLSPDAQKLISSRQQSFSSTLLQYCLLTYQQNGPSRFSDLLSLCHVINQNFEDVSYLMTLIQMYMPNLRMKRLFLELLRSVE